MVTRSLILIFCTALTQQTRAASCCGGSASLPSLITSDSRAQISVQASNAAVTHSADSNGNIVARNSANKEVKENLNLTAAYQVSDYWQMGLSLPYMLNTYESSTYDEQSRGFGDFKISGAYEFLPEHNFSYFKPRGFVFMSQSLPLAESTYESNKPLRSDALGSGFYTTAIGTSFVKVIASYDILAMLEYRKGLSRKFSNDLTVTPGDGHSALLAIGHSPSGSNLRLGFSLLYNYFLPNETSGRPTPLSSRFLEGSFNLSYMISDQYSLSGNYSDQTLFAMAKNSVLTRSLGVSLTRFFSM